MWQPDAEVGVVEDNETTLKQWPCSSCTFLNHFAVPSCEMCGAPSNQFSEQPFITQQRGRRLYSANDADSDEDELGEDDFEDIDEDECYLSERAYDRNPSKRDFPLHRGNFPKHLLFSFALPNHPIMQGHKQTQNRSLSLSYNDVARKSLSRRMLR